MTTVANMLDELRAMLVTWGSAEDQSTTLNGALDLGGFSFVPSDIHGDALAISPGLVEIGNELIYVSNVDANGTCTIPPWGRGMYSTTAATHPAFSRIISQPAYPRQKMLDKLNDTLNRMFPDLFGVKHFNTTTTVPQITYNLPDDANDVLNAEWQLPDGTFRWIKVKRWVVNPGGRPTSAAGNDPDLGVTVDVGDGIMAGRPLHFTYVARPGMLSSESDVFETVTGFGASLKDVCITGAAASLIIANETARLLLGSIEQQDRTGKVPPSAALTAGRYLEQMFQVRKAEERQTLTKLYKPRTAVMWQ